MVFIVIAFSLLSAGCPGTGERELTLIYSGNLNGELEPCGCAEESNQGGIKRRATKIKQLREEKPDLFLISSGGLLTSNNPQDRLTGEYILKGLATMDYDAIGVQWPDLAFSPAFIKGANLPWVASNMIGNEFPTVRVVERAGVRVAFFSWLDPKSSPARQMQGTEKSVQVEPQMINDAMAKAKGDGNLTLLSTTLSLEEVRESGLSLKKVDILLVQPLNEKYQAPKRVGNTLVLQPGTRGMRLGRVNIAVKRDNRIGDFSFESIRLPSSVPDDPELGGWYLEYLERGKEEFKKRARIRRARITGSSPYKGGEACKGCHAQAYDVWAKSKHAGAYERLKSVNKGYDPNCVACHTVGFENIGGFADPVATAHLLGVQCESCHGPSRAHAKSKGAKPSGNAGWLPEKMCKQCHVGPHSPSFEFERYWSEIEHGKRP